MSQPEGLPLGVLALPGRGGTPVAARRTPVPVVVAALGALRPGRWLDEDAGNGPTR